ncbi:MAG: hypothetical protein LBE80_03395 [Deltaproteobacteria bacterium]|jgi:electron transfer flavoprotein alpha/beta subunit|nr:hypothetical protein [Deltaproteobacteria bacterium]
MVPKLEDLLDEDWQVGEGLGPELSYAKMIINPDDQSALELALRLREARSPEETYLAALSLGHSDQARRVAQSLLALGFNQVGLISRDGQEPFAPDVAALRLWPWAQRDFQLILTGARSADGQNGLTAMYLAELLAYRLITEVIELRAGAGGKIEVESLSDEGLVSQNLLGPSVLSVGNAPSAFLRVPSLKDRLKSAPLAPEILAGPQLAGDSFAELVGLERPDRRRQTRLVSEGGAEEKAALILKALNDWGLR